MESSWDELVGAQSEVTDRETLHLLRDRLDEWGGQGVTRPSRLGSRLTILRVTTGVAYRLSWTVQSAHRSTISKIVPSNKAPGVPSQVIGTWDYSLEPPTALGKGTGASFLLGGSGRTIKCDKCKGKGASRCPKCSGGKRCQECAGKGENRCSACSGTGKRKDVSGKGHRECPFCCGARMRKCSNCSGSGNCPRCKGAGDLDCTRCNTTGEMFAYEVLKTNFEVTSKTFSHCSAADRTAGLTEADLPGHSVFSGTYWHYERGKSPWANSVTSDGFLDQGDAVKFLECVQGECDTWIKNVKAEFDGAYKLVEVHLDLTRLQVYRVDYSFAGSGYEVYLDSTGAVWSRKFPSMVAAAFRGGFAKLGKLFGGRKKGMSAVEAALEVAIYLSWADGSLDDSEKALMREWIDESQLPQTTQDRLLKRLQKAPKKFNAKDLLDSLDDTGGVLSYGWQIVNADGVVTDDEKAAFNEIAGIVGVFDDDLYKICGASPDQRQRTLTAEQIFPHMP